MDRLFWVWLSRMWKNICAYPMQPQFLLLKKDREHSHRTVLQLETARAFERVAFLVWLSQIGAWLIVAAFDS